MSKPTPGPVWAVSPMEWGARRDYDTWTDTFTPDDGVALHHGGGTNYPAGVAPYSEGKEIEQLRDWEDFHIDSKGWRGLAYGWGVGQTGTCYRIRGWNTYGAHTGDVDGDGIANNVEIIPVLFIGSGSHVDMTPAAKETFVKLRRYIEDVSGRSLYLYGHTELKGTVTSCPGPILMEYVKAHRFLEEEDMPLTQEDKDWIIAAISGDNVEQTDSVWQRYAIRNSAGVLVPLISAIQFIYRKLETQSTAVDEAAVADEVVDQIVTRLASG